MKFIAEDHMLGERLDVVLAEMLADQSRNQIQEWIKAELVRVNDKRTKASYRLEADDHIEVDIPEPEVAAPPVPQTMDLDVLYEDEHLLVINKAAGLVVHPGSGHLDGTLVNALIARWPQIQAVGDDPTRAGIVHRLDKDTSGVILVALTDEARMNLMGQFQDRTVEKIYWALTERHPQTDTGEIIAPIGRDTKQRKRMAVVRSGKEAVTHFRILEYYQPYALVECKPETGRTHQIRVHLAFIHCPIVGDRVYGYRKQSMKLKRLFLHAKSIAFTHPVSGEPMLIDTALPEKLRNVLQHLTKE